MPIVYKTVTYAINIDLAEEGLEPDASDDAILDAAETYEDAAWDEVDTETFVEAVGTDLMGTEDDGEDVWGDDDGEDDGDFAFDDDAPELPETPDDSEEY